MAKTYIKLWDSYESYFEPLGAAEVGRLVLAMMKYKSSGVEPEFSGSEKFIWPAIKRDLDEDAAYTKKKSGIGKLGGAPLGNHNADKKTSKNKQKQTGLRTKDVGLRKRSSSSEDDGMTMTKSIEDEYMESIGELSERQSEDLLSYAQQMGDELVKAIVNKCSDLGGHSWAYVRKALEEAMSLDCKTVEEYNKLCPIGCGRATRVDRKTPSGNDFLKNAAQSRSGRITKKQNSDTR